MKCFLLASASQPLNALGIAGELEIPSELSEMSERDAEWIQEHESDGFQTRENAGRIASLPQVLSAIAVLVSGSALIAFAKKNCGQLSKSCTSTE